MPVKSAQRTLDPEWALPCQPGHLSSFPPAFLAVQWGGTSPSSHTAVGVDGGQQPSPENLAQCLGVAE